MLRSATRAFVSVLRGVVSPSQVSRRIVTIVVDTVNRITVWTWANGLRDIFGKCWKVIQPFVTNRNSSAAVVWIGKVPWIKAPLLDVYPRAIHGRFRLAVCRRALPPFAGEFSVQASARHGLSVRKAKEPSCFDSPTHTSTFEPADLLASINCRLAFCDNRKPAEYRSWLNDFFVPATGLAHDFAEPTTATDDVAASHSRQPHYFALPAFAEAFKTTHLSAAGHRWFGLFDDRQSAVDGSGLNVDSCSTHLSTILPCEGVR